MNKSIMKLVMLLTLCSFFFSGCIDLEVVNEMEPDAARAFSDPDAMMELAGYSFLTYHNVIQGYMSLALPIAVMADHHTCSWGTTRDYSYEPRELGGSYNNSLNYAYRFQLIGQWEESYLAISGANSILQWLDENVNNGIGEEQRVLLESFSLFVSAVSHGYLGLIFDQAVVVRHDSYLDNPELQPWNKIVNESLKMIDRAVEIADANHFEIPSEWVAGQTMTNIELSQLANAYAARILASSSRTKAANDTINWNRVLAYAQKGHDWDFAPQIGDAYGFDDMYWNYGCYPGWARVDMRIINLIDHGYPSRWPSDNLSWSTPDGQDPEEADPYDARLITDFEYLATNVFPPDRGYYHYSHYRYSRYDFLRADAWYGNGPKPSFLAWEVKLLEAEALLRTGNSSRALSILNDPAGPRKVRGGLPDVQPTDDILRYILDEKEIECFLTGAGISFFDMRRTDRLQPATLLHFPVPSTELEIMLLPHYTIHWVANGTEGSSGSWIGWDQSL